MFSRRDLHPLCTRVSSRYRPSPAYLGSIALVAPVIEDVACCVTGAAPNEVMEHIRRQCAPYELPFQVYFQARGDSSRRRGGASRSHSSRARGGSTLPAYQPSKSREKLQRKLTVVARQARLQQILSYSPPRPLDANRCASNLASSMSVDSGAWMFANTRQAFLTFPDDVARLAIFRRLQLLPPAPDRCGSCSQPLADLDIFTHAVSCTHRLANRTAGALVEKAVFNVVSLLEPGATRTPVLSAHPLHNAASTAGKLEGDVRSHHCGRDVILDVTVTSRAQVGASPWQDCRRAADMAAAEKVREYGGPVDGLLPSHAFVPVAVDAMGTWGTAFARYMAEAKAYATRQGRLDVPDVLSRARVTVSRAVAEANVHYFRAAYGRRGVLPPFPCSPGI